MVCFETKKWVLIVFTTSFFLIIIINFLVLTQVPQPFIRLWKLGLFVFFLYMICIFSAIKKLEIATTSTKTWDGSVLVIILLLIKKLIIIFLRIYVSIQFIVNNIYLTGYAHKALKSQFIMTWKVILTIDYQSYRTNLINRLHNAHLINNGWSFEYAKHTASFRS